MRRFTMKKQLPLIILFLSASAPQALNAESLVEKVKLSLNNLFKTNEQRLKEQEEKKKQEVTEKQNREDQKILAARNKHCGLTCTNIKQKCCVAPMNGGTPYTYCAEKCHAGNVEIL